MTLTALTTPATPAIPVTPATPVTLATLYLFYPFFSQFQSGHIFVFTGMLRQCENYDQIGIILGHEIAHSLLEHTVSYNQKSDTYTDQLPFFL